MPLCTGCGAAACSASPRGCWLPNAPRDAGCPKWGCDLGVPRELGGWGPEAVPRGHDPTPKARRGWAPLGLLIKAPQERLKWGEGPGTAISGLNAAKAMTMF